MGSRSSARLAVERTREGLESKVPKLHQKIDGDWYLRTYQGTDSNAGVSYFGTWQVHAGGLDLLEEHLCCHDDDDVPMHLFYELLNRRMIWNETGAIPEVNGRPNEREYVPLRLDLQPYSQLWRLNVVVDDRRDWKAACDRLAGMRCGATRVELRLGDKFRVLDKSITEAINHVGRNVKPAAKKYVVHVDRHAIVDATKSVPSTVKVTHTVGVTAGLRESGTLFGVNGATLRQVPASGTTCYLVLLSSNAWTPTHECRIPAGLNRQHIGTRGDWDCWRIKIPSDQTGDVGVFFRKLDVG
jgi:hypothetical protein